ncbi:mediator complex subunit MED31 [Cardiosporidium cionae]|uniref:Mediator of RNA polymerase II transcription subunit 31 n=1 Tax=Cardiosporidium cionae TaxID=476202 RepID=A0ABQ7JBT2_9APIC|nr:mediator complex subunit MED31 [Cardiosporidium cionae]|eukprot:KAF8821468.1 mediator complex subunit MED31 [Cardiosporidium cionae]
MRATSDIEFGGTERSSLKRSRREETGEQYPTNPHKDISIAAANEASESVNQQFIDNSECHDPAFDTFAETEAENRLRFETELEFLQCLSNPDYLNYLATNKYFLDPAFVNYLHYLQYWKDPPYCTFVMFPIALRILDSLLDPEFRNKLEEIESADVLKSQMILHWLYFYNDKQ